MDPQEYVRNYTYLLGQGKKAGLSGTDLTSFVGRGLPPQPLAVPPTSPFEKSLAEAISRSTDPLEREKDLQRALQYQKEQIKEGAKYKLLFDIPNTISQTAGNVAALNILGARNATEALATTLASYPRAQFGIAAFQPQTYFS